MRANEYQQSQGRSEYRSRLITSDMTRGRGTHGRQTAAPRTRARRFRRTVRQSASAGSHASPDQTRRGGDHARDHDGHRAEARGSDAGCADHADRVAGATAAGRRGVRHQGRAVAGAGPACQFDHQRVADHRAHPRRRHQRRQRRPGVGGGRGDRRRLPAAHRRGFRRSGRTGTHRGPERTAGHRVRQEHLRRRDQRHHPPSQLHPERGR